MRSSLMNRCIKLSLEALPHHPFPEKHFSFICSRREIISWGMNGVKTSPLSLKLGYPFPLVHSEIASISKYPFHPETLSDKVILNIRLNNRGELRNSKQCSYCEPVLISFGFSKVYYSTNEGVIQL